MAKPITPSLSSLEAESSVVVSTLWDNKENRLQRVFGEFASSAPNAEQAARLFLSGHADLFGLRRDGKDLQLSTTRVGLAGTYFRFDQVAQPAGSADVLPVFDGQVVVLVSDQQGRLLVRSAEIATRNADGLKAPVVDIGEAKALDLARASVGSPVEDGAPEVVRGVGGDPLRVVYRVRISAETPAAAWEILVDAATSAIVSSRDRIRHANGTGLVYDPNPLASTGNFAFVDGNNATTAALDAARFSVVLPNLDGSGFLRGSWVDAHTKNLNQRAQNAMLDFSYTRAQGGFEQTSIYYHLDRTQTRFQALGMMNANARQQDVISDGQQADNSYYDPAKLNINCGTGGVDDAEDADVIVHEYGHAVQDNQVPNYGAGGEAGAMGEGFGDYLAASMARFGGHKVDDPYCIAEWDATFYDMNVPPCLRRLDTTKHFPEFFVGEVHDDGEMWAAATNALDMSLGQDVMMRLVVEGHFSHSTTETFFGASQALLDVDAMLFAGVHQDVVRRRMIKQGLSRILTPPSPISNLVMQIPVSIDNPRTAGLYVDHIDDTQTYTYAGAQALRVHFTTIDTEMDPSCLDNGCDNIYLTNALGDLFQVIFGAQSDVSSVVIPGDTVNIRLVSDVNTPKMGYHVDRIDVLGDGMGASSSAASSSSSTTAASSSSSTAASSSSTSGAGGAGGMMTGAGGAGGSMVGVGGAGGGNGGMGGGVTSSSSGQTSSSAVGVGGAGGNGEMGGMGGIGGMGGSRPGPSVGEDSGCGCRVVGEQNENDKKTPWTTMLGGAVALAFGMRRRHLSRRAR